MSCNEVQMLLAGYALGALDSVEATEVRAHLAGCIECSPILFDYDLVVENLPLAIASGNVAELPPGLRARVLGAALDPQAWPESSPVTATIPLRPARTRPPVAGGTLRVRRWYALVAAAAALLIVVLSLVFLQAAVAQLRANQQDLETQRQQEQQLAHILASPQPRSWDMEPPPDSASGAFGRMFAAADQPVALVAFEGIPPAPQGQSYRLWVREDGNLRDGGQVKIREDGTSLVSYWPKYATVRYDECRLTLERGPVNMPTGPTVVVWLRP